MQDSFKPIAVLGAGSWGTALALHLSRQGQDVRIWSILQAEIQAMLDDHANNQYLPGHTLPPSLKPCFTLSEAIEGVEDILMVVPSVGFRQTLLSLKPLLSNRVNIICASKGLDEASGSLFNEVTEEVLGDLQHFAVLSGPSFAKEVANQIPTAVTIASHFPTLATHLKNRFDNENFNVELSDDVKGVELGGIIKNVIAIACGISDGLGYGINTRSAIITQGLKEITALGVALGANAHTFVGLSGMGDLILTCSDNQSRNKRLGLALGEGKEIAQAEKEIGQVVEGKRNADLVVKLAAIHKVPMKICETVLDVLKAKCTPKAAVMQFIKG